MEAWAIPLRLIDAAPETPYGFPAELFRERAGRALARSETPTTQRASEALPEGGTILDVGVGGGATSLPLAGRIGRVTGVDAQEDMLAAFEASARSAAVDADTVSGRWPDVEGSAPITDVVLCGHVAYNVADLVPFVDALSAHARRRVVMELTDRHPLAWMNDLWMRFHGLRRPDGPTDGDAVAVLRQMGLEVNRDTRDPRDDPAGGGFERREDAVAHVRRRLCLGSSRDGDVADAPGDRLHEIAGLWSAGPRERTVVTLWWDTSADAGAQQSAEHRTSTR